MFLSRLPHSPSLGPLPLGQLASIALHFILIPTDRVVLTGVYPAELQPLLDAVQIASADIPPGHVVVPVHEYQLAYLRASVAENGIYNAIRVLPQTCNAKPQASLRTVTPWNLITDTPLLPSWNTAIKLPIAIRKTSALRTISPWSTTISHELNAHWPRMKAIDGRILNICKERAGLSFKCDDFDVAKHLACIVRSDPTSRVFSPQGGKDGVALCAALVQRAGGGWDDDTVVVRVWGLDTREKRVAFLEEYTDLLLRCFIPPLVEHGFCFDAHGQNTRE